mmetsp:Transcript_24827/g.75604  ORF Transcript_24827/g.75604 Transcript_24827/m.75604 type:complete len:202 (+) Transcript_24827:1180-1785(+)
MKCESSKEHMQPKAAGCSRYSSSAAASRDEFSPSLGPPFLADASSAASKFNKDACMGESSAVKRLKSTGTPAVGGVDGKALIGSQISRVMRSRAARRSTGRVSARAHSYPWELPTVASPIASRQSCVRTPVGTPSHQSIRVRGWRRAMSQLGRISRHQMSDALSRKASLGCPRNATRRACCSNLDLSTTCWKKCVHISSSS